MTTEREGSGDIAARMMDPRVVDPREELVDRHGLTDADVDQVVHLMESLRAWHLAEERMSESSRRYMKLNDTDMRAIRFLVAAHNQRMLATPGALAAYLGISSAATTKLLDRLEAGGHLVRGPHPSDRRALAIRVTDATRREARETVGRRHARRFAVAAALTPDERDVVIRFLDALSSTEHDEAGDPHHQVALEE